jgi:hypothetical protein
MNKQIIIAIGQALGKTFLVGWHRNGVDKAVKEAYPAVDDATRKGIVTVALEAYWTKKIG